jgi:hypothetical protein
MLLTIVISHCLLIRPTVQNTNYGLNSKINFYKHFFYHEVLVFVFYKCIRYGMNCDNSLFCTFELRSRGLETHVYCLNNANYRGPVLLRTFFGRGNHWIVPTTCVVSIISYLGIMCKLFRWYIMIFCIFFVSSNY